MVLTWSSDGDPVVAASAMRSGRVHAIPVQCVCPVWTVAKPLLQRSKTLHAFTLFVIVSPATNRCCELQPGPRVACLGLGLTNAACLASAASSSKGEATPSLAQKTAFHQGHATLPLGTFAQVHGAWCPRGPRPTLPNGAKGQLASNAFPLTSNTSPPTTRPIPNSAYYKTNAFCLQNQRILHH